MSGKSLSKSAATIVVLVFCFVLAMAIEPADFTLDTIPITNIPRFSRFIITHYSPLATVYCFLIDKTKPCIVPYPVSKD